MATTFKIKEKPIKNRVVFEVRFGDENELGGEIVVWRRGKKPYQWSLDLDVDLKWLDEPRKIHVSNERDYEDTEGAMQDIIWVMKEGFNFCCEIEREDG